MRIASKNFPLNLGIWILLGVLALGATAPAAAMTEDELQSIGQTRPAETQAVASRKTDGPDLLQMLARMVLALGVVLGLMVAVLWAARRWMPKTVTHLRGGPIEILASRPIGQRRNLMLVRAKDKTILLGVTPQAIQFLTEIDQEPTGWQQAALQAGLGEPIGTNPAEGTTSLGRES